MAKIYNCKIYWIPAENGGRKSPPTGLKYSTVARFEDVKDKWPNEAWSGVLHFNKHDGNYSEGNIRFLVDWSPNNLPYSGSKFDLFEASKIVATGQIL